MKNLTAILCIAISLLFVLLLTFKKKEKLDTSYDHSICMKALNSNWTKWDYSFLHGIPVKKAKKKGLTIEYCQGIK